MRIRLVTSRVGDTCGSSGAIDLQEDGEDQISDFIGPVLVITNSLAYVGRAKPLIKD